MLNPAESCLHVSLLNARLIGKAWAGIGKALALERHRLPECARRVRWRGEDAPRVHRNQQSVAPRNKRYRYPLYQGHQNDLDGPLVRALPRARALVRPAFRLSKGRRSVR